MDAENRHALSALALANIEQLHAARRRTVEGFTLKWCRECQQDWPCPTLIEVNKARAGYGQTNGGAE